MQVNIFLKGSNMQDQNTQNTNPNSQVQSDSYDDLNNLSVTEDQLKMMSSLTQAQADAAESASDTVKEMEKLFEEGMSEE